MELFTSDEKEEKKKNATTTHMQNVKEKAIPAIYYSPAIAWQYHKKMKKKKKKWKRKKNKISTWMRTQTHQHTRKPS